MSRSSATSEPRVHVLILLLTQYFVGSRNVEHLASHVRSRLSNIFCWRMNVLPSIKHFGRLLTMLNDVQPLL